jgi:hypothetical protein
MPDNRVSGLRFRIEACVGIFERAESGGVTRRHHMERGPTMGAGSTPAGWYPDVERPGGERYWNGSVWTEDRRAQGQAAPAPPAYGTTPPAPYGAPQGYQAYGTPSGFGQAYLRSSNAGVSLGLAIASLVCCGILAIPGFVMSRNEIRAIDSGQTDPSQRGLAKAAYIISIIGLVFLAIGLLYLIFAVAVVGLGSGN